MLLISTAAQSLQGLVDHSLQLPCFFIKGLKEHRTTPSIMDKGTFAQDLIQSNRSQFQQLDNLHFQMAGVSKVSVWQWEQDS